MDDLSPYEELQIWDDVLSIPCRHGHLSKYSNMWGCHLCFECNEWLLQPCTTVEPDKLDKDCCPFKCWKRPERPLKNSFGLGGP